MSDAKVKEGALSLLESDPAAIRQQLDRLLSDPLFRNSRRYPRFLQFVVEHTLNSSGWELKERTLGVDVFGRNPDYDTGTDPVVRITAGEVRKRLAQYYSEPGREDEIRILLPTGSYVPKFRLPAGREPDPAAEARTPVRRRSDARGLYAAVPAALAICLLAWWATRAPARALDLFWNPVLGKSDSVLLSVGQREEAIATPRSAAESSADQITLSQLYYLQRENVAVPDAIALARLGGLMQSRHVRYRIRGADQTNLSDLRENPVILIGAFTNNWNLRLNKPLRFSFERHKSLYLIRDRQNPSQTKWSVDYDMPYLKLATDYAVITRVMDPASERLVVAAGGLGGYGTQAASEFITEPAHMQKLASAAPRDWARKNLQVVISTRVINGSSGPPEIVAAAFW